MASLDLDDADPLRTTDLVGGQADARGVAHRLGHVVEKMAERPVEPMHLDRRLAQDRVAELEDRQDRHAGPQWVGSASGCAGSAIACGGSAIDWHAAQRPIIVRCETLTAKPRCAANASTDAMTAGSSAASSHCAPQRWQYRWPCSDVRQHVEFLAAVRPVAVAEDAQLLEHVERPVDRRGDRPGIQLAAALDELRAGHVPVGP